MDELKTRSIRATEETFEALKAIAEKEFNNQGEALTALVSLWESENTKKVLPEQASTVDNVRTHLQAISDIFLTLMQANASTDERVRGEYAARLQSTDITIQKLQKSEGEAIGKAMAMQEQAEKAENERAELEFELTELKKKFEELTASSKKSLEDKETLVKVLSESNEKMKKEIESMKDRAEAYDKLSKRAETAEKETERLKKLLDEEKRKSQLDIKEAVMEEREKQNEKYDKLREKYEALYDNEKQGEEQVSKEVKKPSARKIIKK